MGEHLILKGETVRLARCRHGLMAYFTTDAYVGRSLDRYGEYSEGEVTLLDQLVRPGQLVVECGANIGAHTVFLAGKVGPRGRVVAFEPQRRIFQLLCANVALNELGNVQTFQTAVGAEPGRVTVPVPDYEAPGNFGGTALEGATRGEPVPVVTLDSLALPACHLIKIDVEGMEAQVLAGAARTIARHRPLMYLENDRRDRSAALIQALFDLDYRLFWHTPPLYSPDNFRGRPDNCFGRIVSVNMLAIPREADTRVNNAREITTPDADWRQPAVTPGE